MRIDRQSLASIREALLSGTALAFALFAAFAGFGLGMGIMAYHAIVDGTDFTLISWALIPPTWGLLALFWFLLRKSLAAAIPLGAVALFTAYYYSDVYGQYPAIALFLLAMAVVFLPTPEAMDAFEDAPAPDMPEPAPSSS